MAELTKGTLIGPWEIVDVLGSGAFGITYRAQHYMSALRERKRMQVAIKELFIADVVTRRDNGTLIVRTGATNEYRRERELFKDEAATIADIVHPNIVAIRDVIEANNTYYMVMDLADGPTIQRRVKPEKGVIRPYSPEEWRPMLLDLLSALDMIHNSVPPVLHRDIKPGNIGTMKQDGRPVLLDFGAARYVIAERSQKLTSIFTAGYAPYEQYNLTDDELEEQYETEEIEGFEARALPNQGPRTDIYSLAATSYFALTGKVPTDALRRKFGAKTLPPLGSLVTGDRALIASIDKALSLEPENRFQSAAEWLEALGKSAPWAPVVSRPASAASPPQTTPPVSPPPPPSSPTTNDHFGWIVLAVVAFGALLLWFQRVVDDESEARRQAEQYAGEDAMVAETPSGDPMSMETPSEPYYYPMAEETPPAE